MAFGSWPTVMMSGFHVSLTTECVSLREATVPWGINEPERDSLGVDASMYSCVCAALEASVVRSQLNDNVVICVHDRALIH